MITAEEYRKENTLLMKEYEKKVRNWLNKSGTQITAAFFKDGIIDPDVWFQNDFRPLFILKEVHDKKAQNRCIDFVAMKNGEEYDIWERRGMWRALGTLAKGIINGVDSDGKIHPYEELYQADLNEYHETLRHIAIINIKKVSGGNRNESDISMQTRHFLCHACKFGDDLKSQIELINPSIIICCGTDIKSCFEIKDNRLFGIPVVFGLHPSTNPNCRRKAFYDETIEKVYKTFLK